MNNSNGYIRIWDPSSQAGVIFGCDGPADGQNEDFVIGEVRDPTLRATLTARAAFALQNNCNPANQPPDTLWVSFFADGSGNATNILPV